MISVCEEEEKILRKYIVKYTLLDSFATPLQKKIHTIYTSSIKPSIYIYMNLKAIFSCFNNCFAAAAASAASTSLLQLRVWWPLTNERGFSIICCFYAKVDRISSILTCIL